MACRVDGGLDQFQRQGDEVAGHHGVEQEAELLVEIGEAGAEVVVIVNREVAGWTLKEKVVSVPASESMAEYSTSGWPPRVSKQVAEHRERTY